MMCISSSSTIINSCCYVLMVLFITSTYAYVIDSDELRNSLTDQQFGLNVPLYYDRFIRTTKFPRIGRSPSDIEEFSPIFYTNSNTEDNEENNNENESRWMEQRSVLFPRIGKRGLHNLHWANSLSYPHHILEAQGRDHIHQNQHQIPTHYRGKRNLSM